MQTWLVLDDSGWSLFASDKPQEERHTLELLRCLLRRVVVLATTVPLDGDMANFELSLERRSGGWSLPLLPQLTYLDAG